MTFLFVLLLILATILLGIIVLIQNPKGGGLTGNIVGFSNQFMGVKQTTDVLEKGTWIFIGVIALLSILSTKVASTSSGANATQLNKVNSAPAQNLNNSVPLAPSTSPQEQTTQPQQMQTNQPTQENNPKK